MRDKNIIFILIIIVLFGSLTIAVQSGTIFDSIYFIRTPDYNPPSCSVVAGEFCLELNTPQYGSQSFWSNHTSNLTLSHFEVLINKTITGGNPRIVLSTANGSGSPDFTNNISVNTTWNVPIGALSWHNISLPQVMITQGVNYSLTIQCQSGCNGFMNWKETRNATASFPRGQQNIILNTGTIQSLPSRDFIFQMGAFEPNVNTTKINPLNNTFIINSTKVQFSATSTPTAVNITNITILVFRGNGTLFNETVNITESEEPYTFNLNISLPEDESQMFWNVRSCGIDLDLRTTCDLGSNNFSFITGHQVISEFYPNSTSEGAVETFQINISINPQQQLTSGTLIFNNTAFSGTLKNIVDNNYSITRTITIPSVTSNVNQSFHWEVMLTEGAIFNTTTHTVNVAELTLDDCSSNSVVLLNYTIKDEEDQTKIEPSGTVNTTFNVDLDLSPLGSINPIAEFNKSFQNVDSASICISSGVLNKKGHRIDALVSYKSTDRVQEFHNIQNLTFTNTTATQNISLFDLKIVDSQEFLITFKDENFLTVQDALIDINRRYIQDGVFRSVEVPKTDEKGQVIAHLVISDVIYTIIVKKNGKILATFDNVIAVCQDQSSGQCNINLNAFSSGTPSSQFETINNLAFTLNFSGHTASSIFSTLDGSVAKIDLNISQFGNATGNRLCTNSITTSSGSISCTVPSSFGNGTLIAELYKDGELIAFTTHSLFQDPLQVFGYTGVVLALMLYLTLPLMFITDRFGVIIGAIMGLILAGILNLVNGGSILGLGSTILWFIIAGGILIWKIGTLNR